MRSVLHPGWQPFVLLLLIGFVLVPSNSPAQPGTADLQIMYTSSPSTVTLGQYFKCSVYVYNPGWDIATNIMVTNQIPPGLEFVSVSSTRGVCSQTGNVITWQVGDFLPSYFATMTMEFKATGLGTYTNNASAASATPELSPANNLATLTTSVTPARFFGVGSTHVAFYSRPTLTLMTNNQVLVIGQHLGTTADLYNMSSRTFSLPNGPTFGAHEEGTATVLSNGLVLIAGGLNATGDKIAEVYNPGTQLFRRVGDMLVYCYSHHATLQPDGTVMLCGGTLTTNALFNPVIETFSPAPVGLPCPPAGARLPDGKYFQGSGGASIYDPFTGISTPTGPMNLFRFNWTATFIPPDKVLVAGGDRNSSAAELYDITSGNFSVVPSMNMARNYHSATLLPDGTVLIVGGVNSQDLLGNNYAEVFDPVGAANAPGIGVSDASVVEGSSGSNWLQFTVWLTTTSTLPVSVNFATATGSAGTSPWGVGNVDFVATNGTLTIPPGQTNATISVPIFCDLIQEPDETMTVTLSQPIQAWMARSTALGRIFNDDSTPTVSIFPVTPAVSERDSGVVNLVYNVTMSAACLDTVTVDYSTSNETAQAGADYIPIAGTLTYQPGETNKVLIVQVIGELQPEPDETFKLSLSNATNVIINIGQATGTILNDDGFPGQVHHFDVAPISGLKTQTVAFPITITARDAFGNTVTNYDGPLQLYSRSPYVGATNLDFEQPTLAPWSPAPPADNPGPYELIPYDVDGDGRLSSAFRFRINYGNDGLIQNVSLTGGVTYRLSVNLVSAQEGGGCWLGATAVLQIGNSNASANMPNLCGGQSGRQTISLDYTAPTNGLYPLSLIVGWGSVWYETPAADYYLYADDLRISYPVIAPPTVTNGFVNGVWNGTASALQGATNVTLVADDTQGHQGLSNPFDVLPIADLNLSASSLIQGTPPLRTGMKLQFNLALTNRGPSAVNDPVVSCPMPANLTFLSATNLQGVISNHAGLATWSPGRLPTGTNFTAVLVYRADIPGDFVNQFNVTNSILDLTASNNSVALSNHIEPPLLVIGDASGTEVFASATGMVFGLTLSGPSAQTITVDYLTANGTATNNFDFVSTNGTLTFLPGTTNRSIVVYALDDILDEPNRTFTVQLINAVNAVFGDSVGLGTVVDDDPPPAISIADINIVEGDIGTKNAVFPLTLSKPAIMDVTVQCSTATVTAGTNDFISTTATATFPAGTTNATFSVPIRGNTVNEPDETFVVTLSLPSNAIIGRASAVGTILNDDAVPGRLDHFVWNAVSSPQFAGSPFPVTLRAVDYVGNPATNASITALVTARTENSYFSRLQDDFEDGDSFGWTNYLSSFSAVVTNETAAGGNNSLRLTGFVGSTTVGLRSIFTNITPNKISFAVRASRTNQVAGRFTATANNTYRSAVFYFNNNGQMGLLDRTLGFRGVPYQSNRWYQVDLTLDWIAQKIDCRVDGNLVLTNITFPDSSATYMNAALLANQDNTTSWWDNARVFHDNFTNTFSVTPSNFTAFVTGVKSNLVTINAAAPKVWLIADDGNEHVGLSGLFDLQLYLRMGINPPTAASNVINLAIEGAPGFNYRVESSSNLANWSVVTNLQSTGAVMRLQFPPASGPGGVFYRTVVP